MTVARNWSRKQGFWFDLVDDLCLLCYNEEANALFWKIIYKFIYT